MNLLIGFLILVSLAIVHGQQSEKATSIIPFPRIGRADRFFMSDKRNGASPGLIPFPRIGRGDGSGMHESKRQLIPFPRVGKRPYFHYPFDPYFLDYEESVQYPAVTDAVNPSFLATPSTDSTGLEENEEKRNGGGANGGGMWFGPRLGKRRKRSIEESGSSAEKASLDTRTLVKILHNFNWAIVPIKERRTSFTPRLGRSSEEVTTHHHKSQPYSPRLGRSSREESFVELENEEEKSGMSRYSRSGSTNNNSNSPTQAPSEDPSTSSAIAPFSPRLGRDHFSPRLGRSGEDHE